MIKMLFFDLGSTLIDESDCAEYRTRAGLSKPDLKIFKLALNKSECIPSEAYMIGDRLDNDIEPAAQLGMHTIWVRQGSFANGNLNLITHCPDHTVNNINDISEYL